MSVPTSRRGLFLAAALALATAPGCQGEATSPPPPEPLATGQALTCGSNLVPQMTSATLPGGTVTASGVYGGTYDAWRAFDRNDATMWISTQGAVPAWIGYEWANGPKRVTHYAIKYANGGILSRAPRTFTLQGWNGSAWVVVDTRPNEITWTGFERREYAVASPGSYVKYRLNVTEDNDSRSGIEVISMGGLELFECQTDTEPPTVPVLTGFTPVSPSKNNTTPVVAGTTEAGATVKLFLGASCQGTPVATVTASATGAISATLSLTANTSTTLTATATDAANNVSACSAGITYQHDSLAPPAPTLTGFTPVSPSANLQPFLSGTGEPNATVRLFAGSSCQGTPLVTVTASATTGAFSKQVFPTANTSTSFSATTTDAAGNTSSCSNAPVYQHDNIAPGIPVFASFSPASPSSSTQPSLNGTAESSASVRIHSAAGCVGTPLSTVTANATTGAFTLARTVAANASTTFSARAVDAAGNGSSCSAPTTYVNDSLAPALPTVLPGVVPFTTAPFVAAVQAQTEPGARVALFTDAACTVPSPSTPEAFANTTGLALVPLLPSQLNSQLFVSARDAAGNRSGCASFQTGCSPGTSDCDGNPANGCEATLMSDEANCGTCGNTCGGAPSANAVCGAGTCGLGCMVGTFDCDGSAANGCESATACDPATCSVVPFQELLITDLSVVEDPVRTTGNGAWTFGTLMREMNGGADPSQLVRTWLRTWEQPQFLQASVAPPRPAIRDLVTDAWEARSGGPGQPLDFNTAPFRLLAIVNRIDLRQEGVASGEGRFVFGVLDPFGFPMPFTVIFEYVLPGGSPEELQRWARDWHELTRLGIAHPDYRPKLQALTDRFTKASVAPGRFMGSAISQVRTNENSLDFEWELREFHFGATGLAPAPVALTPEFFLSNSPMLGNYINQNQAAILAGTHDVPATFQGQPFQAASSITPFFFFFNASGVNAEARHQFSVNTCNGCHAGETNTFFLHVGPREQGQQAFISPFLVSASPTPDPTGAGPGRVFQDLGRRRDDLAALVCGEPPTLKAATDRVGETLLAPWRKEGARRAAVPGFPPRSNLPAGRIH
ncbi:Ig-like domain-containing protein [Corallococcus sp. bb12-1]|uniref:Ig-like domain-containing protein n=1 Tax=Corallococcus sp. bb12-1 TaxID=2996784 RepID=UPI00226E22DF|nr:Ig-like domain-containing protein [Corallococcus sp. bb12-1]MCY1043929.1 Ig-like domain-containing protein [Corallococcus sp. bb12-1]